MIRLLFSLFFVSACFFAKGQSLHNLSFGTDSTLEVLTWNVEWFPKAGQRTIDSVRQVILALDADVIALQEVADTNKCKQMLSTLVDYELVLGDPYEFEGLAYIYKKSTIQVQQVYHVFSSWSAGYNFPRAPFVLEMECKGRDFVLINNHLKCCGDGYLNLNDGGDEETRRFRAMNTLKGYMDNFLSGRRVIMLGDLNDEIQEPLPQNVFQQFIQDSANYKFVDLAIANASPQGWSYPRWPSHLDHILINQAVYYAYNQPETEVRCFSIDEYLPGGLAEYEQKISDHRPLGLKIKLKRLLGLNNSTLEDKASTQLKLYPNPAQDYLILDFTEEIQQYEILDAFGQVCQQKEVLNAEKILKINLTDLPKGLYFICLHSEGYTKVVKKFTVI